MAKKGIRWISSNSAQTHSSQEDIPYMKPGSVVGELHLYPKATLYRTDIHLVTLILGTEDSSSHRSLTFQEGNLALLPHPPLFAPLFARHLLHMLVLCLLHLSPHDLHLSPSLPSSYFLTGKNQGQFSYNILNHTKHIFPSWLWCVHESIKTICTCISNIPRLLHPLNLILSV